MVDEHVADVQLGLQVGASLSAPPTPQNWSRGCLCCLCSLLVGPVPLAGLPFLPSVEEDVLSPAVT